MRAAALSFSLSLSLPLSIVPPFCLIAAHEGCQATALTLHSFIIQQPMRATRVPAPSFAHSASSVSHPCVWFSNPHARSQTPERRQSARTHALTHAFYPQFTLLPHSSLSLFLSVCLSHSRFFFSLWLEFLTRASAEKLTLFRESSPLSHFVSILLVTVNFQSEQTSLLLFYRACIERWTVIFLGFVVSVVVFLVISVFILMVVNDCKSFFNAL